MSGIQVIDAKAPTGLIPGGLVDMKWAKEYLNVSSEKAAIRLIKDKTLKVRLKGFKHMGRWKTRKTWLDDYVAGCLRLADEPTRHKEEG